MERKPPAYLCGTPKEHCTGGVLALNHGLEGRGLRGHSSPSEAFNCQRRYLLSQGYEQVGSRDFRPPGGGPILILTKKSRYGGKLRNGKLGTRNQPTGIRGGIVWG